MSHRRVVSPQSFEHFDADHFQHLLQNSLMFCLFAFQFHVAAVKVLNAHFQILLESLATKHRYVTSTSVLNSDKFL